MVLNGRTLLSRDSAVRVQLSCTRWMKLNEFGPSKQPSMPLQVWGGMHQGHRHLLAALRRAVDQCALQCVSPLSTSIYSQLTA